MADKSKGFMDLPVEMLVHIFQFVGIHECVTEYTKTCNLWREVIALHILEPELERVANMHRGFKSLLEKQSWTQDCDDIDLILRFYDDYDYYSSKFFSPMYIKFNFLRHLGV